MGISKTIPWRSFATPDAEFTYTASAGTTASIKFRNVSEPFTISWGDGAADTVSSTVKITHTYQSGGDFPIKLFEADNKIGTLNLTRDGGFKSCTKLPAGLAEVFFSLTGISYQTSVFPSGISVIEDRFGGNGQGPVSELPPGADEYDLGNQTKMTGTPADVPRGAPGAIYDFKRVLSGGNIADMPADGSRMNLRNCPNIGKFQDAPDGYDTYGLRGAGIGGTLQGGPTSYTVLNITNTPVSGSFADFPAGVTNIDMLNANVTGDVAEFAQITAANTLNTIRTNVPPCTYSGATGNRYDGVRLQFRVGLTSAEVDSLLIDINASGIQNGTLELGVKNAPAPARPIRPSAMYKAAAIP